MSEVATPEASPVAGPQPQRPDAFVSYSRRDGEFVQRLVAALAANGKDLWVDLEDIPKSADWRARIEAGIESAKAVVVVVSPSFVSSHVCGEETRHALRHNKRLVSVLRAEVDRDALLPELVALNWITAVTTRRSTRSSPRSSRRSRRISSGATDMPASPTAPSSGSARIGTAASASAAATSAPRKPGSQRARATTSSPPISSLRTLPPAGARLGDAGS
jgi:hypothetical protein